MDTARSGRALFICCLLPCCLSGNPWSAPTMRKAWACRKVLYVQQNAVAASRRAKIDVGRQYWRIVVIAGWLSSAASATIAIARLTARHVSSLLCHAPTASMSAAGRLAIDIPFPCIDR